MATRVTRITLLCLLLLAASASFGNAIDVGVYYYPGWRSDYINWKDVKGLPGSRSAGKPWPERQPLLGYYPEEEPWVAAKHASWASQYGITFFAYDWYWDGGKPEYDHALKNYLRVSSKVPLKFCLLWANHFAVPKVMKEYDDMVVYWLDNYFNQASYYRLESKPVIFVYSYDQLETNARLFGSSAKSLLARASAKAKERGYPGIYFVTTTNAPPSDALERTLLDVGFDAYTGWNYVESKGAKTEDYDVMVSGYLEAYRAAGQTAKRLTYLVPASPGWDSRPWSGSAAVVRSNPTPDKFVTMLRGAKQLLDADARSPKVVMIESWNEFGEGSYIEPTKKWGMAYLDAIKKVFGSTTAKKAK
ncbi:hypothetical protein GMST_19910 [Geomonas silvestris]|uniref:Glycosyltransferase WbsX n=1 Tax=Geomonas silvestris TaxID=2740184 RepID=A0A6V8MI89_9BACT|nr:glycoside hydrolase family 99-like domain-containing protein [Geomonas silvestris]GFO59666.1 hypothetical protein GMST_19910 [Geomonas silvestris]